MRSRGEQYEVDLHSSVHTAEWELMAQTPSLRVVVGLLDNKSCNTLYNISTCWEQEASIFPKTAR